MPEPVEYDDAVAAAFDAVMVIDAAYAVALVDAGIHEDDVIGIQQRVREIVAELLAANG